MPCEFPTTTTPTCIYRKQTPALYAVRVLDLTVTVQDLITTVLDLTTGVIDLSDSEDVGSDSEGASEASNGRCLLRQIQPVAATEGSELQAGAAAAVLAGRDAGPLHRG